MVLQSPMNQKRPQLDCLLAWLAAAIVLAIVNAAYLIERVSRDLRLATRLWIHFYDLGFFVLLGLLGAAAAWVARVLFRRLATLKRTGVQVAAVALIGALLGLPALSDDFANFAANLGVPFGNFGLAMLVGAIFAPGVLWAKRWVAVEPTRRYGGLVAGVGLALLNGKVLAGDYPGIHLSMGIAALFVLTGALYASVQGADSGVTKTITVIGCVAVSIFTFALSPSRAVRQNLGISPGSCVFPFVAPWLSQRSGQRVTRLAVEQTPWFRDRSHLAAIPPTPQGLMPPGAAVVFLTVDALRADVVEERKHDTQLPNLAHIRDAGLRFTRARSPTPSTLTTVTSILAGKYYSQLYFATQPSGKVLPVGDRSIRVPELLSSAGVRTVQVLGLHGLGADAGVGRGFTEEPRTRRDYGRAAQVMDLVLGELERLRKHPTERLFLYSHFVDSHAPYTLGGKRATEYESYLAELELVDRELGRLLQALVRSGLNSRCLLVIAADHGEAFGEHGLRYHARSVYDELLRVPLIFFHPRLKPAQRDVPVTLIDMSSTLLDLFGVATPGGFMGQTLVPLLQGKSMHFERPIAADSGRRKQAILFDEGIKVHLDLPRGTVEVFDIERDPAELHDLTDDPTRDVEPYIAATERFFATHTLKRPGWKPPWRSF